MRGLNNIINLQAAPNFWINDIGLLVPPTSISMHKEGLNYSIKSLRTTVSTKVLSGNGIYHAQVNLTFPPDGLVQLHRLICQIKNNPFVFIKNEWIQKSIDSSSNREHSYFTVMGLNIINHPSALGTFNVELDLRFFNENVYNPNLKFVEEWGYDLVRADKKETISFSPYNEEEIVLKSSEIKTPGSLSIRDIDNSIRASTGGLSPVLSIGVVEPKDSKAYVRYCNYLQSISLRENFGIEISSLKNFNSFPDEKGFHSVDEDLINFRNELIELMLINSSSSVFSFRSFALLKYTPDFYKYLRSVINDGIDKDAKEEDKQKKRKENFERFLKSSINETTENEPLRKIEFEKLKDSERSFSNIIPDDTEANKYTYYPLTDSPEYTLINQFELIVNNNRSLGEDEKSVYPIFAPTDGEIVTFEEDEFSMRCEEGVIKIKELESPDIIRNKLVGFFKSKNIKKGTLVGFITGGKPVTVKASPTIIAYYMNGIQTSKKIKYTTDFKELKKYVDENFSLYSGVEGLENVLEKIVSEVNLDFSVEDLEAILGKKIDNNKLANEDLKNTRHAITAVSGSLRNVISSIPILGQEFPAHQFLGCIEPEYQVNIIAKDNLITPNNIISFLEQGRSNAQYYAKNFSAIPDAGNFMVESFITRLLGSFKESNKMIVEEKGEVIGIFQPNFVINSLDTFTIEGSPNSTGLNFRFSESKSYRDENLRPVASNKLGSNYQRRILESLKTSNILQINNPSGVTNSKPRQEETNYSDYKFLNWKTKYYNSNSWYSKKTKSVKNIEDYMNTQVENDNMNQDYNSWLLCLELDKIQDVLSNYESFFTRKKGFTITIGSTFDSKGSGVRETISNHFHGCAADIRIIGMNVMEACAFIEILMEEKKIKNPKLTNNGTGSFGLGIYGIAGNDINSVMDGESRNGFIHIDLNAKLSLSNGTKSINGDYFFESFQYSRRRWLGKSGDDQFNESLFQSFWKDKIVELKKEIRNNVILAIRGIDAADNSQTNTTPTQKWVKVPAFEIINKSGVVSYSYNSISDEFSEKYMAVYNKVKALGGVLTSGGGKRDLSSLTRPILGMHNIGRAIDLGAYTGLYGNINESPETIKYLVIRDENRIDSKFTIWCPINREQEGFDATEYDSAKESGLISDNFTVYLIKNKDNISTYNYSGEAFNLTKIFEENGFERISPIDDYKTQGKFRGTEWWHYEIHEGLVANQTTALSEMLKFYTLEEAQSKHKYFDTAKDLVWKPAGYFGKK